MAGGHVRPSPTVFVRKFEVCADTTAGLGPCPTVLILFARKFWFVQK